MIDQICQCGTSQGQLHWPSCPYPMYWDDEESVGRWEEARAFKMYPDPATHHDMSYEAWGISRIIRAAPNPGGLYTLWADSALKHWEFALRALDWARKAGIGKDESFKSRLLMLAYWVIARYGRGDYEAMRVAWEYSLYATE